MKLDADFDRSEPYQRLYQTTDVPARLRALGVGAGDEVIVPAMTAAFTALGVISTGATPVIVDVEVKRIADLSPRDIEHDNPEFRRLEDEVKFLEQIYGRTVGPDDIVTVIRFSQIVEPPGAHFGNGETPHHN